MIGSYEMQRVEQYPSAPSGLPNVVVAGAPRCGTSALFSYLAAHPDAAGSSVKEVQYFMDAGSPVLRAEANYHRNGLDAYRGFFRKGIAEKPAASVVFEATPGYLYQETAVAVLPTLPTRPRFVFQLRKPSEQVYSSYVYSRHRAGNLPKDVSFREFAFGSDRLAASKSEFHRHALDFANYDKHLSGWVAACGDDRIRVGLLETMRESPRDYLAELAAWLGIDPDFYADYAFAVVNENAAVRIRALQGAARRISNLAGRRASGLRAAYRRVNMTSVPGASDDDRAVMAEIDERLQDASRRLGNRFALDVASAWGIS
jgi:hypothetical protein